MKTYPGILGVQLFVGVGVVGGVGVGGGGGGGGGVVVGGVGGGGGGGAGGGRGGGRRRSRRRMSRRSRKMVCLLFRTIDKRQLSGYLLLCC